MIDHWMKDYSLLWTSSRKACSRTVASTGKANFRYADRILSGWKDKGVRHLTDIQALDTLHKQLQSDRQEQNSGRNRRESVHRVPVTDSIISSSEIMITINLKISF